MIIEWEKGRLKASCDMGGLQKVNGIIIPESDEGIIVVYGKSINGIPVRGY